MSSIYSRICKEEGIFVLLLYRSHSERIFNKVQRKFHNDKSMLEIKKEQLAEAFPKEHIFIAGDDLTEQISWPSAESHVVRDTNFMIGNTLPFAEVLGHTFEKMLSQKCTTTDQRKQIKHLFITYPTCPTFDGDCYKKAIVQYYQNVIKGEFDSIMSGESKPGFFWMDGRPINYQANRNHQYTQDIKRVFEADNALWGGEWTALQRNSYLINEKPYMMENKRINACDVDTMEDFEYAQQMMYMLGRQKWGI